MRRTTALLFILLLTGCDTMEETQKDLKCYSFIFYNDPASARALKVLPFMYSVFLFGDEKVIFNLPLADGLTIDGSFIPEPPVRVRTLSFFGNGQDFFKDFQVYKGDMDIFISPLYLRFEKEIITDDAIIFKDSYGKLWRLKSAFPLPEYLKERFKNGTLIGPGSLKVYCDTENNLHIEFSHRRKPKSSQGMVWEYVPQCEQ